MQKGIQACLISHPPKRWPRPSIPAAAGAAAVTGTLLKGEPGHLDALLLRSRAYIHLADLDLAKRHLGEVRSLP